MHTMTETSTFKCILTHDKLSYYNIVFVMMTNKQTLYFSDYYKYKTHAQINEMLKILFKTFLSTNYNKRKAIEVSDKDEVVQMLPFLQLT